VASLEQRVERVEVHVDAHQQLLTDLRAGLRQFEARVDARFAQVEERFTQFEARVDARFAQIDGRFAQIDERFLQLEGRFVQMDGRFLTLDQKVDAIRREMALQFRWLAGIMLTGMVTLAAAMLAG